MKLNCLHLIIIQHDLPLCRGRYFQMSLLRETQLSPRVKVISGRKVALSYMLIVFEISLESLSLCLGVFSFLAVFLFWTAHFYHFAKLLAHSADGNDRFYVCPPQLLAQCQSWCTLVFCPLPTPEDVNRCFRQWGHNFVNVVSECGDIKDRVDTVCGGAAEVLKAGGVANMIMIDYLEWMYK